jgi:hypothetical protein
LIGSDSGVDATEMVTKYRIKIGTEPFGRFYV